MINKKKKLFIFATIIFLLMLSPYPLWQVYVKLKVYSVMRYYEKIKNNPKVYSYDITRPALNPAFYISDLNFRDELIAFYDSAEKGKYHALDFPIEFMPYEKPLILLRYTDRDSMIAEVVDFNTDCWGFIKGYVYKKTLHKNPPPKKLLEEDEKYWKEMEKTISYQRNKNFIGNNRPYGIHCD